MTLADVVWFLAAAGCLALGMQYASRVAQGLRGEPRGDVSGGVGWRWHLAALVVIAVFLVHPDVPGWEEGVWTTAACSCFLGPAAWLVRTLRSGAGRRRVEHDGT